MIEQHYPSKRKVDQPIYYSQQQYQGRWNGANFTEINKAKARDITVEEYRERVIIVAKALAKNKWKVGDIGYPHSVDMANEHGVCRVASIVTHYDHYGNVEWNDPPFLLSVISVDGDTNAAVQCTPGWLVEKDPREVATC